MSRAVAAWTHSGMTISITVCARFSPASAPVTTKIMANSPSLSKPIAMALFIPVNIPGFTTAVMAVFRTISQPITLSYSRRTTTRWVIAWTADRLSQTVSIEELKLAAGLVILSPFIPLLFMGEEYGETAPFPYFISHSDAELAEAVRRGRSDEFAAFGWQGEIPDPRDARMFLRAKLNHELRNADQHLVSLKFYRELIRLRKKVAALNSMEADNMTVEGFEQERVIVVHRWQDEDLAF